MLHIASARITTFFYFTLSSVNKLLPNLLMLVNVLMENPKVTD